MVNYLNELMQKHPDIKLQELMDNSSGVILEVMARNYLILQEFKAAREKWMAGKTEDTLMSEIYAIAHRYHLSPATVKKIGYTFAGA